MKWHLNSNISKLFNWGIIVVCWGKQYEEANFPPFQLLNTNNYLVIATYNEVEFRLPKKGKVAFPTGGKVNINIQNWTNRICKELLLVHKLRGSILKRNVLPEYPNSETSTNKFLIYWKHRERRIGPVTSHKITVKARIQKTEQAT